MYREIRVFQKEVEQSGRMHGQTLEVRMCQGKGVRRQGPNQRTALLFRGRKSPGVIFKTLSEGF